jgi:5-deoxy-glucuronate isomerase
VETTVLASPGGGTRLIHLRLLRFDAGDTWAEPDSRERLAVVLGGTVDARVDGTPFGPVGGRNDVFEGPGEAVYVPPETELALASDAPATVAIASAPVDGRTPGGARVIHAADQRVTTAGTGNWQRTIRTILGPDDDAGRLIVGETVNPPGNWSSYPPHKHDRQAPPEEVALEEVYYYRLRPEGGFAVQLLYEDDVERAVIVRDGDAVAILSGYHPVVAAAGYELYYLWVLAGEGRELVPYFDPQHAWVQTLPAADLFSLAGRVAVVTGGSGALGSAMAAALADAGAIVGLLARDRGRIDAAVSEIGGTAFALEADVLDRASLDRARDDVRERHGRLDVLVNAAGGNLPAATVGPGESFFDLPADAFDAVVRLNLHGTVLACQAFGPALAPGETGTDSRAIVNVSSLAAGPALTRVGGYGAAKAAIENLTRWLAVDLAQRYGDRLRVNAIAPGFVVGEQNRALLLDDDGELTERGRAVVGRTPAGRLGEPADLVTTLLWLCSPASRFVTGVVVPVDGGFNAWSGV